MPVKRILQIFREGIKIEKPLQIPLMDGEQGNFQTLQWMIKIVQEDRHKPLVRDFVLSEMIKSAPGMDFAAEIQEIFDYCQKQIIYRKDPLKTERLADIFSALYTLNHNQDQPEGDCGIKSIFLATALAAIGHEPFYVIIKQNPDSVSFNHIYNAVRFENELIYLDATPQDAPLGWEASGYQKQVYPIF